LKSTNKNHLYFFPFPVPVFHVPSRCPVLCCWFFFLQKTQLQLTIHHLSMLQAAAQLSTTDPLPLSGLFSELKWISDPVFSRLFVVWFLLFGFNTTSFGDWIKDIKRL
jgi:hypothetical protein